MDPERDRKLPVGVLLPHANGDGLGVVDHAVEHLDGECGSARLREPFRHGGPRTKRLVSLVRLVGSRRRSGFRGDAVAQFAGARPSYQLVPAANGTQTGPFGQRAA